MKLRVFQSDKGDCILLQSKDGKNILCDGGMKASYSKHVAPALGKMQEDGEVLDVVYVSHIDQDHISGVLQLADDLVEWKIFDFQVDNGNATMPEPDVVRPPDIDRVWNNAFHDQIGKNSGEIASLLAARARVLSTLPKDFAIEAANEHAKIAQSEMEAVRLSRRLGDKQLRVRVNPEFDNRLMLVTDPSDPISVGSLEFTVIGPFAEDLRNLRAAWNDWLRKANTKSRLAKFRVESDDEEEQLGSAEFDGLIGRMMLEAKTLGDRKEVTLPNLASLMFHVRETTGETVLLTGDGHWADILAGLESTGLLPPDGGLHVNVLKVQHHGSENNWHHKFGKRVTADHYVFCGNGKHENPDLDVVQAVIDSRVGPNTTKGTNPGVNNPFKLWFNCASNAADAGNRAHLKKLEKLVQKAKDKHGSKIKSRFLKASFFDLEL